MIATLANAPGRCEFGFSIEHQHPGLCGCRDGSEWATFLRALKTAAKSDGTIHQTDVRPLIQAIPAKHRGTLYRRARTSGVIVEVGLEPSTDHAGRNADKLQRVYRLAAA